MFDVSFWSTDYSFVSQCKTIFDGSRSLEHSGTEAAAHIRVFNSPSTNLDARRIPSDVERMLLLYKDSINQTVKRLIKRLRVRWGHIHNHVSNNVTPCTDDQRIFWHRGNLGKITEVDQNSEASKVPTGEE